MKKQIKRTIRILVAAVIVLSGYLPLPARYGGFTSSAQTAGGSLALPTTQGEEAVQQLKQQGLYDSLEEAFAAARYESRWEDRPALGHLPAAYHAPNPAQRLSAYFTPDGLHLTPHKKSKEAEADSSASEQAEWQATMKLVGYGYQDNLVPVGEAEIVARGNRIEYRRAWLPLTEWYVNKAGGLEQGFTLAAPPGARGEGDRLRLALELTGNLQAELEEGGQAIALKQEDGALALGYSDLHAYDAQGACMPSQMRVSEGQVILEVDDTEAVYPVTIDPLFTQQGQLTSASDGEASDRFGSSVAFYYDTAVVGVPFDDVTTNGINKTDQGSAYVFVRSNGGWSRQAQLTASGGADDDHFGHSVAINWDTIVVGAVETVTDSGSAYVFVRSGTTWSQQTQLLASSRVAGDLFGNSVAISRDYTVVVGAPHQDVSGSNQGAAFVFVRNGAAWPEQTRLLAGDRADGDEFGTSVAINENDGNRIVVGAPHNDIVTNNVTKPDQGSAYVFARSNGFWNQEFPILTANDGAANDEFGFSVSINGTAYRVAVGAHLDDIVTNNVTKTDQGSAYVFARSNGLWNQVTKLTASDGLANDNFGHSVAISGYEVVVGVPFDDVFLNGSNRIDQGSAYAFLFSNGAWSQQARLVAGDGAGNDKFGFSVAILSGTTTTIVVGAPFDDVTTNNITRSDQGSAYVFIR